MKQVAAKAHARLGPSGWDWWSNCPGAPALSDGLPNSSNIFAAEGSVAHDIASKVLDGDLATAGDVLGQMFQCDGFDIVVDDDMVDYVDQYVEMVRSMADDGTLMVEQEVPIGHLTGEPGAEGTSDAIIITGKRMTVVDLKYGMGVRVNAAGNGQGRMYALGALQKLGAVFEDIDEVKIVIAQVRLEDGITDETLNLGELEEFKDEVEIAAGRVALADSEYTQGGLTDEWADEYLNVGDKQCRFCDAKARCPKLKAATSNALALVSDCPPEDFADLTMPKQASSVAINPDVSNVKLAEFLRAVPLIEEAVKGVRAEVERRLFDGQEVPGFYLGVGRKGNRKWVSELPDPEDPEKMIPVDIEAELKKRLGATEAYEKKPISVATAEKKFKNKPKTWAKIKALVTQADGKPSVCQDGDKNERYVPVSAADFADLSVETEAERLLS
jgi:Protein of unknown function (DUF2800).